MVNYFLNYNNSTQRIIISILVVLGITISFFAPSKNAQSYASGCSEYGIMAYSDGLGNCKCSSGYVFGTNYSGNKECISGFQYCTSEYGFFSTYDILTNTCKCMSAYQFGIGLLGKKQCIPSDQVCKNQYGLSALYDSLSDTCKCMSGYLLSGGQCISESTYCFNNLGLGSRYNSLIDQCECNSGYELSKKTLGGFECTSCIFKYGLHSSYDYLSKTCECDSGYTLNDQNQCVQKQNNVYFTLKELKTDSKEAIIKSDYDFQYYHVTYGVGCLDGAFSHYLNNKIVVNLGADFNLDIFDKIVLQNDDETCNVISKERVSSDFILFPETEIISGITPNITNSIANISASSKKENIPGYSLVKTSASSDVYAIYANTKRKIRSIDIFNSYDWPNQKVKTVSQATLDSTPDASLIKTPDNPNVYILEKGFKRLLASVDIFNSYGLDWNKVVTMNQKEMDSYQIAPLIKHGYAFYWLDTQRVKHMFPSTDSLATNGYDGKDAITVNDLEFGSYADGLKINK